MYDSFDSYVTIRLRNGIAGVKTSFWDNMLEIHKTTLFTDVFNFHQLKRANTDPGHVVGALVQMIQSGDYFPAQTWVLHTTGIASPSKVRLDFEVVSYKSYRNKVPHRTLSCRSRAGAIDVAAHARPEVVHA